VIKNTKRKCLIKEMDNKNYIDYRCIEPTATTVGEPWFRISDSCPCNPNLSNPTGRGFTPCPFGVQFDAPKSYSEPIMTVGSSPSKRSSFSAIPSFNGERINNENFMPGAIFPKVSSNISKITPPQLQPRQIVRIGQTFRS
jgi:hypothetical protein